MSQISRYKNEKQPSQLSSSPPPLLSSTYSGGSSNTSTHEILETTNELSTLQCKHLLMQQQSEQQLKHLHSGAVDHFGLAITIPQQRHSLWMENYSLEKGCYTLSYGELLSTLVSILFRAITVCINIRLALNYYSQGHQDYFIWTVICVVTPMFVTLLIHGNMCYQDGKFSDGFCQFLQTTLLVLIPSFFFRYWNSLLYALKCKRAELQSDKAEQLKIRILFVPVAPTCSPKKMKIFQAFFVNVQKCSIEPELELYAGKTIPNLCHNNSLYICIYLSGM